MVEGRPSTPLTRKLQFCCLQPRRPVLGAGDKGGVLGYTLKLELQDPNSLANSTEGCKILKIR